LQGAGEAIREAIRLDPEMPNYHALQAGIEFKQGHWTEALAAAERGLAMDAGHVGCTNLRALALVKLRRPKEAGQAFEAALARDPDNAITHANQGWALLQEGDAGRALHHFREALRLDADYEMARQGVIEAFKARYLLYQLLLRFMLWMSRMSRRRQWVVLLGGVVGYLAIEVIAYQEPELRLYILPIQALCILFAVLTWIADPLFNLVLRLDRMGRSALSAEQVRASTLVGVCLLAATTAFLVWFFTDSPAVLEAAGLCAALTVPVTGIFDCPRGWRRRFLIAYTLALLVAGSAGVTQLATTDNYGVLLFLLAVMGAFLAPWLVLLLLPGKPPR
jgi:hypothetical protein